jgi:hypothetical protein
MAAKFLIPRAFLSVSKTLANENAVSTGAWLGPPGAHPTA